MMQALGISLDIIDRCENHVPGSKARRSYSITTMRMEVAAWAALGKNLEDGLQAHQH